ncbi:MAG: polyisoprenoid-binding protein [Verrucomicrobia bacterium]|nr:polyisoprenoid-binding protein [Verrucomicrobiota bacterium]MCH8527658.1 YceI family protein [Kiritimatiellia bacterium]
MTYAGSHEEHHDKAIEIDKDHTSIGFNITHMVISRVRGSFEEFDGSLTVEDGELKAVKAEIQVASINTANRRRDDHLKSDDFFDAENFPVITFESTSVEEGKVTGNLTIKGITREVVLDTEFSGPATDPWGNVRYGLTGSTTINRTDFGLTWNQALEAGGVMVGEEVRIEIGTQVIVPE